MRSCWLCWRDGKQGAEHSPRGEKISAFQYQNDEGVQKTVTTMSGSLAQCESTKHKRQTNHNQSDESMVTFTPGSPAFYPSRYTIKEPEDMVEEIIRVCREMQRRRTARLDEVANRVFESDDEESEKNSDEGAGSEDGPNDIEKHITA